MRRYEVFDTRTAIVVYRLPWRWLAERLAVLLGPRFDYDLETAKQGD